MDDNDDRDHDDDYDTDIAYLGLATRHSISPLACLDMASSAASTHQRADDTSDSESGSAVKKCRRITARQRTRYFFEGLECIANDGLLESTFTKWKWAALKSLIGKVGPPVESPSNDDGPVWWPQEKLAEGEFWIEIPKESVEGARQLGCSARDDAPLDHTRIQKTK